MEKGAHWKIPEKRYSPTVDYACWQFVRDNYKVKDMGWLQFKQINRDYNQFIRQKILEGHSIGLPQNLGILLVRGRKGKPFYDKDGNLRGLPIDWNATKKFRESNPEAKEQRKVIYHTNEHTDGVIFKIAWKFRNVWAHNKELYYFKPAFHFKRDVVDLIKANKFDRFTIVEPQLNAIQKSCET